MTHDFRKRPPETAHKDEQPRPYKASLLAELIDLDRDVMKLLVRRSKLVHKLRGGKTHAASPAAAKAERDVRTAWEKNALMFSRDDKFTRQLFALLQEIRVESRENVESRPGYNLAPARKPVALDLPGLLSVTGTRLAASVAAWLGAEMHLESVALNTPLVDWAKSLNVAGAGFSWRNAERPGEGTLAHVPAGRVSFAGVDRAVYVGDDPLNAYLAIFLSVLSPGKSRLTGGASVKMADFSCLRRFLPSLGARFAPSVPKSNGFPASVEASVILPDSVVLPGDLPREGLLAFLCSLALWKKPVNAECGAVSEELMADCLAECLPVFAACGTTVTAGEKSVLIDGTTAGSSALDFQALDPALSAYLLALPALAGGEARLRGRWVPEYAEAKAASSILAASGLSIAADASGVSTRIQEGPALSGAEPAGDSPHLAPLALALAVSRAARTTSEVPIPAAAASCPQSLVESFIGQLGLECRDGKLCPVTAQDQEGQPVPWSSPDAWWAMAYALCGFDRPNISLANPAVVNDLMPSFWTIFNALPDPSLTTAKKKPEAAPRRRIRTSQTATPEPLPGYEENDT